MEIKKRVKDTLRPIFHLIMLPRVIKLCKNTNNRLWMYKDKYKGKQCFIVANGPSLTSEDLNKIKREITFGVNRIYIMYEKTEWRPSFYICQDATIVRSCKNEIEQYVKNTDSEIFINPTGQRKYDIKNAIYYSLNRAKTNKHIPPDFGIEGKFTFSNGFVIYTALQLAVFMGFKRIYLIGADHHYSSNNVINRNSYPDPRMYDPKKVGQNPDIDYNTRIYCMAKKYCDEHNIEIYNATRGGELEVFKRVDLDEELKNIEIRKINERENKMD